MQTLQKKNNITHCVFAFLIDGNGELGEEGAQVVANFLEPMVNNLRFLKCSFNELGDDGTAALLEPFCASRNVLEELHLECNELEERGAEALVRAQFPKLKILNLGDNMDLPKAHLKEKYGEIVSFGGDDDADDDEEMGNADLMDALIAQFQAHTV